MVKQYSLGQTARQANWRMGAKVIRGAPFALRSLAHPGRAYVDHPYLGTDPQPERMSRYARTKKDQGGVHTNSGIPNKAFYLIASSLGGYSWEKAGKIWYETLPLLRENETFAEFARKTIQVAKKMYPNESEVARIVESAWTEVEVLKPATRKFRLTSPPPRRGITEKNLQRQLYGWGEIQRH